MVAEGGEGENPLPFSLTAPKRGRAVFVGKRPQAPGGPGPKPWGPGPQAPWRPGPQAPGAWIPPLSLISCKPSLTSCCVSNPWVRVNPQSADLGAVQFHERRGSRLRSSISAAGPGPKPLKTWPTSQPCIPVKNSKNAPVLIGSLVAPIDFLRTVPAA